MEPSQLGSLKGLCGTWNTRVYTGSAPYGEGKSLRPVEMVLIRVTITRQLKCYARLLLRLLSSLNHCRVVPLYREADAQQPSESRPAHKSVRLGLSIILALHYKFYHNNDCTTGPKPHTGLKPISGPPSSSLAPGFW